ncbi:hypothetical protein NJ959_00465 [Symplocastrum sp. BBK-W-15]|uniref:Uncharacterized protein n=1 Tax=Limnofasciculus baicalensis BBK-W-15 TaxID=2699891 RepID=A0AAE3GLV2_9CYAN|nr:hypothetical protein [Limnofasciculus baicalensis BBK-W-15]
MRAVEVTGIIYFILKVRVKNSNIQKGKSAGYRLIYSGFQLDEVHLRNRVSLSFFCTSHT